MWGWFGGSGAQQRKDAPKKAILGLRQQLDMLQKREKHLENQMAEQDAIARKNVSTNKTGESSAILSLLLKAWWSSHPRSLVSRCVHPTSLTQVSRSCQNSVKEEEGS